MTTYHTQQKNKLALLVYVSAFFLASITSSCSTQKGYNYKKHYRKQNRKTNFVRTFDLNNCRKNNHAYKY